MVYFKTWGEQNMLLDLIHLDGCGKMAEGKLPMENSLPRKVAVILLGMQ